MGIRDKFEEKIKRKEAEIQELENKIREAKAYLQALQDSIKILPREDKTHNVESIESFLRPNSNVSKVYELLKKSKKALHIDEILVGIGKSNIKKDKVSLAGSLGWYVRRNEIFSRPAPNTFGLISNDQNNEPPEDFGMESTNDI